MVKVGERRKLLSVEVHCHTHPCTAHTFIVHTSTGKAATLYEAALHHCLGKWKSHLNTACRSVGLHRLCWI